MQQTTICTSCGAEMSPEARFCRKCGQASTRLRQESVTEGTTRILEAPDVNKLFGQEFYEQHGHLAQQTNPLPAEGNQTVGNLSKEAKNQNRLLLSTIIVASLAVIAIILFFTLRNPASPTPPPTGAIKRGIPPVQPPPSPPPPPPAIVQGSGDISHQFPVYPDARITMQVTDPNGGNVLQLRTSDSLDKVINWYTEKLRPTEIVRQKNAPVILRTDQTTAVIKEEGSETSVLLHQGND